MNLPDAIQIGPIRYTVSTDRHELNAASVEMQGRLVGHSDHVRQTITLDPDLGPDALAETLFHEVLHALFEQTAIADELDPKQAERVILRLSPAIVDVLRRNPPLTSVLAEQPARRKSA